MTGSDFAIEPFADGDAEELAAMHVQVWREAYTGMIAQDYLDAMVVDDRRIAHWRKRIGVANAQEYAGGAELRRVSRLARHVPTGRIAGFCQVGAARDENPPVAQELGVLNVLATYHGTGVAGQLVAATLGDVAAYLWVVDRNARAIAFYRKLGFELDGGRKHDDALRCEELRMLRRAGSARSAQLA